MQTIYRSLTPAPVERLIEIAAEREAWMKRALDLQKKYNNRRVITQHDNLTGADLIVGLEDSGITPYGWSQYGQNKYLIPSKNSKGEKALNELAAVGKSPEINRIMCEEFDLPPYYQMGEQVYYPGFEVLPVLADENGPEGYEPGDTVDMLAYMVYNVYAKEAWEGNEHFERVKVWEFYRAKDM